MTKSVLGILILLILQGCNVAEQTAVVEEETSQSAQNDGSPFDIRDGQNYLGFQSRNSTFIEGTSLPRDVYLFRDTSLTNLADPVTVRIEIIENGATASLADIASITDELGNTLTVVVPGLPNTNPYFDITIPANDKRFKMEVDFVDDAIFENERETIVFSIQNSTSDAYQIRDFPNHQFTIVDDENPPIYYVVEPSNATTSTITEGDGVGTTLEFTLTPSVADKDITFNLSYSGSANLDDFTCDYISATPGTSDPTVSQPLPNKIIVPAGSLQKDVIIRAKSDSFAESTEDLIVTIDSVSSTPISQMNLTVAELATFNPRQLHTITVNDDAGAGSNAVNIVTTCPSITENLPATECTVEVALNAVLDEDSWVDLSFSGTANQGVDYSVSQSRLFFQKNSSNPQTKSFKITPLNDGFREGTETITVTLNPESRLSAGGTITSTISLNDDEAAVEVGFSVASYQVGEGSNVIVPIILNNPSNEDIIVNYTISTGPSDSATIGVDHNLAASGTFTISSGSLTSSSSFLVTNDAPFDDMEVIYISLTSISSGTATLDVTRDDVAITIRERSALPIIEFSTNFQAQSEGNSITVTVNTDKVSESAQDYVIALTDVTSTSADYTAPAATLNRTFPANVTTDTFTIPLLTDTILEPTENFILSIASANQKALGSVTTQFINITDTSTPPTLDVSTSNASINEGGVTETITFSYAGGLVSGFDVPITYTVTGTSTSGVDHDLASGVVTLLKGQNSVDIDFNVFDDGVFENATETIIVTASAEPTMYSLGIASVSIDINDQQVAPTVSFGGIPKITAPAYESYYNRFEGDNINLPVNLNRASSQDINIEVTVIDKWNGDTCDTKCSNIFSYDSLHKVEPQITNNGMDEITSAGIVGTTDNYRITFEGTPTVGSIDVKFNDITGNEDGSSPYVINASDINGGGAASIEDVCDNLVDQINDISINGNIFITGELYAFHKSGTDYVDIRPRPRFLDTDLHNQLVGDKILMTIPAGNTQGVISFNLVNDAIYEGGLDERFELRITLASGGTVIDTTKDQAVINIRDVHVPPSAQFVEREFARTEPATDDVSVVKLPVYLSNMSEVEMDYRVIISNDPTSATFGYADENDFIILDTVDKGDLSASNVFNRVRGTISATSGASIPKFPRFIYNETEIGQNILQAGFTATMDVARVDSVATPSNAQVTLSFDPTTNIGTFTLIGTDASSNVINIPALAPCGTDCSGPTTATAVANHINTTYDGELIASASGNDVTIQPAYMPSLQYTSNVIKTFDIRVPAGKTVDFIPILIENDLFYEGSERLSLTLQSISAPVNTSVDANGDAYNVAYLQINDDEGVSQISITSDTTDEAEGTLVDPENDLIPSGYTYNDVTYSITINPLYQREDLQFEVEVSGDMDYQAAISSPAEFMTGDYRFDVSTGAGMDTAYNATISPDNIVLNYPAGYSNGNISFIIKVHEDYRYEEDETLTVSLANNTAGVIGSPANNSIIFSDDDASYVYLGVDGNPTYPLNVPEYQPELEEITLIASDQWGNMFGRNITQVPASFDYNFRGSYRHSTDPDFEVFNSASLTDTNNYSIDVTITQQIMGDFRQFDSVSLFANNFDEINYLPAYGTTSYNLVHNLTVPNLIVKTSVFGFNTGNNYNGHTCTVSRGQMSCFGDNVYGQLGKEIEVSQWGGGSAENELDQAEVLNLGINPETGHPAYVIDIALGKGHTCALFSHNEVKCWGVNDGGQLGRGEVDNISIGTNTGDMSNLIAVDFGTLDKIDSIYASSNATCAFFKENGYLKCWGINTYGILGIDSSEFSIGDEPEDMGINLEAVKISEDIELFAMGVFHACAKTTNGLFGCWGLNEYGVLGNNVDEDSDNERIGDQSGEMANVMNNTRVDNTSRITDIAIGPRHTCVNFTFPIATPTYTTRCFGLNHYGQLGLGRVTKAAGVDNSMNLYSYAQIDNSGGNESNLINRIGGTSDYITNADMLDDNGHKVKNSTDSVNAKYTPTNATNNTWSIDLDVPRNQFVQIREPASTISAGGTFSCGVYDTYYLNNSIQTNKKHIRCWGSNKIDEDTSPFRIQNSGQTNDFVDIGVLNNTGWSQYFSGTFYDGTVLPPFRNNVNGIPFAPSSPELVPSGDGTSCDDSEGSTELCNFVRTLGHIGKLSALPNASNNGDDHSNTLESYYLNVDEMAPVENSFEYGWLRDFEGTGRHLNFELNHAYSIVRYNFEAYDDIELNSGAFNTCAMPRMNGTTTHPTGSNQSYMCWGANHAGQTGQQNGNGSNCTYNIVGGFSSCPNFVDPLRTINYTY